MSRSNKEKMKLKSDFSLLGAETFPLYFALLAFVVIMAAYFTVTLDSEEGDENSLLSFETLEEARACVQASLASSKNREKWRQVTDPDSDPYGYVLEWSIEAWVYEQEYCDLLILEIREKTHDSGKNFSLP